MRYKQQKENSGECGPVAIYNVMKWLNKNANLNAIKKELKCSRDTGTTIASMIKFLKKRKVKMSHKRPAKMNDVVLGLQQNKCVLYLYQCDAEEGHYVVFTGYKKKYNTIYLKAVNEYRNKKHHLVKYIPIKFYNKKAQKYAGTHFINQKERIPQAWIIKKKKSE